MSRPQVRVDPAAPAPRWRLSPTERERVAAAIASGPCRGSRRVVPSGGTATVEAAGLLADALGAPPEVWPETGEVDRCATGFVPGPASEARLDRALARPGGSEAGRKTVTAARARIASACGRLADEGRDAVTMGHGTVGTLPWCHLAGAPIARRLGRPPGGGCRCAAGLSGRPDGPGRRREAGDPRPEPLR